MNVLIFGFQNNISRDVVSKTKGQIAKYYLNSNIDDIKDFVINTDFGKYDYVIGCGSYSGKDRGCIRIETKCNSQFRNSKDKLEIKYISYFMKPETSIKLASGIGNSWCNLVSYMIMKKSPDTKYTFLHIPKSFNGIKAAEIISEQLKSIIT